MGTDGLSALTDIVPLVIVIFFCLYTDGQVEKSYYTSYKLHTARTTWFAARETCMADQGFLVEITTSAINSRIQNMLLEEPWATPLRRGESYEFWTGLYDTNPPMKQYVWTNSCSSEINALMALYTSPTLASPCFLSTDMSVTLRPEPCEKKHMFICQITTGKDCVFQQESKEVPFWYKIPYRESSKTAEDCEIKCSSEPTCAGGVHCPGFRATCLTLKENEMSVLKDSTSCTFSKKVCYGIAVVTLDTSQNDFTHVTNACGINFETTVNISSTSSPSKTPNSTIHPSTTSSSTTSALEALSSTTRPATTPLLKTSPSPTPSSTVPPSTTSSSTTSSSTRSVSETSPLTTLSSATLASETSLSTALPSATSPFKTWPSTTQPSTALPSTTNSSKATPSTTTPRSTTASSPTMHSSTNGSLTHVIKTVNHFPSTSDATQTPSTETSTTWPSVQGFIDKISTKHTSKEFNSTTKTSTLSAAITLLLTTKIPETQISTARSTAELQTSQTSRTTPKGTQTSTTQRSGILNSAMFTPTSRNEDTYISVMPDSTLKVHHVETVVTSMAIVSTTKTPSTKMCTCRCSNQTLSSSTQKEGEFLKEVLEDLEIDRAVLSSRRRKYSSADDDRPSARCVGYLGAAFLFIALFLISFFDLVRVTLFLLKVVQEFKKPLYESKSNVSN